MQDIDNTYAPLLGNKNEDNEKNIEEDIKKKLREGFIVKVFGIVAYQVIIVFLVVLLGFMNSTFRHLILTSSSLLILAALISFVSIFIPIYSPILFRLVPQNYIILTIFSLSYSWIIASYTLRFTATSVLIALILTIAMVTCLIIYAFYTKTDFTIFGGTLFTSLSLLVLCSLFLIFFRIKLLYMIYIYVGLIIFCIYLIYDVQLLIGNSERKFSEDDYILAAINIYLDIIAIFIRLLEIFGSKNN